MTPTPEVEAVAELKAMLGYMLNAAIDLETGAPKRTALATLNGGINRARLAIAALDKARGDGWRLIDDETPKGEANSVIIAVTGCGRLPVVGEAYFNHEAYVKSKAQHFKDFQLPNYSKNDEVLQMVRKRCDIADLFELCALSLHHQSFLQ